MSERNLQLLLRWMNAGVIISRKKLKKARILMKYESKIIFIVRGRICRYNKHRNIFFKSKIIFIEGRRNAEENARL